MMNLGRLMMMNLKDSGVQLNCSVWFCHVLPVFWSFLPHMSSSRPTVFVFFKPM